MISNLDPASERFLLDLTRIQKSIGSATQAISSGLRVNSPSDAPDEVSDILQLYADIERNGQIRVNLGRVSSEVLTAQTALETAVHVVDRARVLASQGAGSIQTAETRQVLAGEVTALLEQLVSASRTIVEGRYIFSGDEDQVPPYQVNLAKPNGVDRLSTAAATRQVQHPSGLAFTAEKTAQEIFDNRNADDTLAADNVFAAVNGLRVALEGNDQAGIESSLVALRSAGTHLNDELSFYGFVENKLDEATDFANRFELQLKTELSNRRDADLTEAILELERGKTHEAAALGARALLPKTSLFDYLS
jgi:flagellar hook-associated protein 3 FlgL